MSGQTILAEFLWWATLVWKTIFGGQNKFGNILLL
jgi:hypothetical protein